MEITVGLIQQVITDSNIKQMCAAYQYGCPEVIYAIKKKYKHLTLPHISLAFTKLAIEGKINLVRTSASFMQHRYMKLIQTFTFAVHFLLHSLPLSSDSGFIEAPQAHGT